MKAKRSALDFVRDLVAAGRRAMSYVNEMSLNQFLADERTRYAVRMCIAVIGEAANRATTLDPSLKEEFPEFEAEAAYAMRIIVTHGYFKVDNEIMWRTAKDSVPKIVDEAEKMLAHRDHGGFGERSA